MSPIKRTYAAYASIYKEGTSVQRIKIICNKKIVKELWKFFEVNMELVKCKLLKNDQLKIQY